MRTDEQISADADRGKRPFSNMSEYEFWAEGYCFRCVHDDMEIEKYCPILGVALLGGWPKEWTREKVPFTSVEGEQMHYERVDVCTEFDERTEGDDGPEPEPVPDCDGQLDLIDAYLDTAIGELTPRTVPA